MFDRAHAALLRAALLHLPPSPGSQGRPLTPRLAPTDRPEPLAPAIDDPTPPAGETETGADESTEALAELMMAEENPPAGGPVPATPPGTNTAVASNPTVQVPRATSRLVAPDPVLHVVKLHASTSASALSSSLSGGRRSSITHGSDERNRSRRGLESATGDDLMGGPVIEVWIDDGTRRTGPDDDDDDGVCADGIAGWEENDADVADELGEEGGVDVAHRVPSLAVDRIGGGTEAAKKMRMEARRKFLAARTRNAKEAASKVG